MFIMIANACSIRIFIEQKCRDVHFVPYRNFSELYIHDQKAEYSIIDILLTPFRTIMNQL